LGEGVLPLCPSKMNSLFVAFLWESLTVTSG
jgi:hypothetical protein